MDLGVQIYGCMNLFRENPEAFFKAMSNAGYTNIEPCIAFGTDRQGIENSNWHPIWLPEEVSGFKKLMSAYGLTINSFHAFGNAAGCSDELIKLCKDNDISRVVLSFPSDLSRKNIENFAAMCKGLAEKLRGNNLELWLHNHFAEIKAELDGKSVYETALELCGGIVGAQVDVGWVLYGGREPAAFLERISDYLSSVHYKDIKMNFEDLPVNDIHTALGSGALQIPGIYKLAYERNIPQLIDQDDSDGDFMADLCNTPAVLSAIST